MDTGASTSFIRREEAVSLSETARLPEALTVELGRGSVASDEVMVCFLELDSHRLPCTFTVIPDLTEPVIVGADFFRRWKIKLDPEREAIILDPDALRLKLILLRPWPL
jgi:hypothetical protein